MKKLGAALLTGVLLFSIAGGALAKGPAPKEKEADVSLQVTELVEVVYEGESVELEAVTKKKGSSYDVKWSFKELGSEEDSSDKGTLEEVETNLVTLPLEEGSEELADFYVSEASFTGLVPGTYEITASVVMQAGKSHVSFVGNDSVEQEFKESEAVAALTGFVAKNFVVTETRNPRGNITGYNVTYDLFAQYDNGTEELYQSDVSGSLSQNQLSKNESITIDGVKYTYVISRP